ncbi:hypothetical protein TIFTF001_018368 [Ficus carica]|uniref:AAA-type ATPase N-terminal domain-containing protein n=1 Tax=Ficus carica TaxID=3494 RepID=A0AA88AAY8_FICCA|nr:hypothetical protein TIFTF001_018368 [Ficus carica]
MFSATSIPSATAVLSTYTTFAASAMVARTVLNELHSLTSQFIPQDLRNKIIARIGGLLGNLSPRITLAIDEYNGLSINEVYQASDTYLSTRITTSNENLKVFKTPRDRNISVTVNKG